MDLLAHVITQALSVVLIVLVIAAIGFAIERW